MCLVVGTKKLVAKTDLLVYKCLDYHRGSYCTPYRYLPIVFDKGVKTIDGGEQALTIEKVWSARCGNWVRGISHGVHAYYKKTEAQLTAKMFPTCGTKVFYAVIPKGCAYYIGMDFDVVATKMIVFRSKKSFDEYAKEHEIKEI